MHHRTPQTLAAAAALALVLGACSDVPTSAPTRLTQPDAPVRTLSASGATLIPNTVKYRDNGGKPATGRSGSAALRAFALLGRDGVAELELEARSADSTQWWVSGLVNRAQVRALDADGSLLYVRNLNDMSGTRQTVRLGGLARGHSLRVQANVSGIDPHRTDVVTVTERLKLRPDVATQLQASPRVPYGQPVVLNATLSELNGDVGALADCVLLVDGVERDAARYVWVDAGDAVTCSFTHVFAPGVHQVQVEARNVAPADWDLENNRSERVQVDATEAPSEFEYYAAAGTGTSSTLYRSESRWYNPTTGRRGEQVQEWGDSSRSETAFFSGYVRRHVPGEVTVDASQSTGGRVVHSLSLTEPGGEIGVCASRYEEGTYFNFCTYTDGLGGVTSFYYYRTGGSVTYHSSTYAREWDDVTGEDLYFYTHNSSSTSSWGPLLGMADDFAFRVRVAGGGVVLTASSDLTLRGGESSFGDSFCSSYEDPWDGTISDWCLAWIYRSSGRSDRDGSPFVVVP